MTIPEVTTRRLSLYLRVLTDLQDAGVSTVSSSRIAERCDLNPAQVRKDLSRFGGFGTRGVGYKVPDLRAVIEGILGLDRGRRVIIVGAGNLGNALGDYPGFNRGGFDVVGLFDVLPDKIGQKTRGGRPIHAIDDLVDLIGDRGAAIGIVAVPATSAQEVVDRLVAAGVRAILNFAPSRPRVPEGISIRHVDLSVELESLSFFLSGRVRAG